MARFSGCVLATWVLTMKYDDIMAELRTYGNPERARVSHRYFKTGAGEYGEGDVFLGIAMFHARTLAKKFGHLPFPEVLQLLHSPIHEARMLALLVLSNQYLHGDQQLKEHIYELYLNNTKFINNWDLVDASAPNIVGRHLERHDRKPLHTLAASSLLWDRRIAIMATFHYIRLGDFHDTLAIARFLLEDKEDLIHKAVGWMLRETGKRDQSVEEAFLREHYVYMPRTMLRYAVERFPVELKRKYMAKP
jgi:3-methyladenine DNA glycosylase AlkD